MVLPLLVTLPLLSIVFSPVSAQAGVLSAIVGIFARAEASSEQKVSNINTTETGSVLLRAAVNTDPNLAKGGGDITVVDGVALLSEAGPTGTIADITVPHTDQISVYVVRKGDTLSSIAGLFNVSVNTILWANNLGNARSIQPGQELLILPVTGVRHTVKKGDTLSTLAKAYKADVEEIAAFNGLADTAVLAVGEVVIIPGGEIAASVVVQRPSASVSQGSVSISTSGYFINPAPGSVVTQRTHGFNAVDLGTRSGASVVAAAGGTVIVSRVGGWNGGYGNYIVIRHNNGTQTLYAHLSTNLVGSGETVVQGQKIGTAGSTGRSTGPHLHFEVRGGTNPFAACSVGSYCGSR